MIDTLTTENLLLLADHPADLTGFCNDLIARLCNLGRQPFVVTLTQGKLACFALDHGRQLAFGIPETMPLTGPVLDAAVKALCFVSWRYDCNLLGVAGNGQASETIAKMAAEEAGLQQIEVRQEALLF